MFANYLKISVRNLLRQRVFSFINIFGLTLGLMSALLIGVFIQYEYSFDKHFKDGNRIYRIATIYGSYITPTSALPLANSLQEKFPEVEQVTRLLWLEPPFPYFSPDEEKDFQEQHAFYADKGVIDVFGLQLLEGNASSALTDANTVILSQSTAHRYFGTSNALNKTIRLNNKTDLRVTGVFRDLPANTHFDANILISSVGNPLMRDNSAKNWDWLYACYTYVKLKKDADIQKLDASLKTIFYEETEQTRETHPGDYLMYLQSLHNIHFGSHLTGELKANTNYTVIYTFVIIAVIIVVIACINYVNLSTAQSMKRAREVGMRKVLGGHRFMLVIQFLIESIAIMFLAVVFSLVVSYFAFPAFNEFIGSDISFFSLLTTENIISLTIFTLVVGIVAGTYPAFFLSGFVPSHVLKGKFSMHRSSIQLRKTLVVIQFCIGFMVLVGTLIVNDQLKYMLEKDLGYKKENVVMIELPADSIGVERVKAEFMRLPNVISASKMSESFTNVTGWYNLWYEGAPPETALAVTRFHTDEDFAEVMNVQLKAGRFFNKDFRGDSLNYVLNESAIQKIGWSAEEAIGKKFGEHQGQVIGVIKNFNFRHLNSTITPFAFFPPNRKNMFEQGRLAIRIEGHLSEAMQNIETKWKELVPAWPLKFSFVEEEVSLQYQAEAKLGKLTGIFSAIGIIISGLGLLGLVSFAISQRVKEIGIRKVLGASVKQLTIVTTKEFVILVITGIGLGTPLAYLAMDQWLQGYAFRISISAYPFIVATAVALLVAIVTVCSIALRASTANPVDALKQE